MDIWPEDRNETRRVGGGCWGEEKRKRKEEVRRANGEWGKTTRLYIP